MYLVKLEFRISGLGAPIARGFGIVEMGWVGAHSPRLKGIRRLGVETMG